MNLSALRSFLLVAGVAAGAFSIACGDGNEGTTAVPPTISAATSSPSQSTAVTIMPVQPTALPTAPVATPAVSTAPSMEIESADLGRLRETASMPASGQPFQEIVWRRDGAGVYVVAGGEVSFLWLDGRSESLVKVGAAETLLDISSDGLMAVTPDRRTVTLRPASGNGAPVQVRGAETITAAHFSADATFLAVTVADRIAVQLYDTRTGEIVRELTGFETAAPVYSVQIGPDGREIIWHARATAQVQDLVSEQLAAQVETEDFISALELKPDRTELVTASANVLTFWDLEAGEAIDTLKLSQPIRALSFTPSGNLLAVAVQGSVRFIEKSNPLSDNVAVDATGVEFSPAGAALAIVGQDFSVSLWSPPP